MLVVLPAFARADIFIAHQGGPVSEEFASQLQQTLGNVLNDKIHIALSSVVSSIKEGDHVIITLGTSSLIDVSSADSNIPILSILMSRTSVEEWSTNYTQAGSRPIIVMPSTPAPILQTALVTSILGVGSKVSLLYSQNTSAVSDEYQLAADKLGVTLIKQTYNNQLSLSENVLSIPDSDALILQKQTFIKDMDNLSRLFLLAYDKRSMAVLGYSSKVVNSGALATTYFTQENISNALVHHLESRAYSPGLQVLYPAEFNVAYNKYVARSLGIAETTSEQLKSNIMALIRELPNRTPSQ
jgi:ABC-type uncharacterized transport system substrate-binding protein